MTEQLTEFEKELRAFDWFYGMSDDHSVWKRGASGFSALKEKAKSLGEGGMRMMNDICCENYNPTKFPDIKPVFSEDEILLIKG